MQITILFTENYQLFYLKKAINELLENYEEKKREKILKNLYFHIDHINGCDFINGIKFPIIFPLYLKNYISLINKEKLIDYNFVGTITQNRNWINKYLEKNSIIKNSKKGRKKNKYEIDKEYYNIIAKSKFTLSPTGDCPWSYRFFEAILCYSIPIVENNTNDIYVKDYFFYYESDEHIYNEDKAIENYKKLVNSSHFLNNTNLFYNE